VGIAVRLFNLRAQVLGDDELHAVRSALAHPVREILVTYEKADNCIPLSALFRLLLDAGVRLSEILLRTPGLAAGILLLALLPWAAGRALGRGLPGAAVFAWLLALSPPLVLYSRIVRSYMPVVLLGAGAAVAFWAWWRRPRLATGAAYVVSAALAVWFHLGAGPWVASPLLFGAGALLLDRGEDRWRNLLRLSLLAAGLALGLLAFLLPARASFLALVREKHRPLAVPGSTVLGVLELQAGNSHLPLALLFWGTASAGLALLFRRDRPLALYTVVLVAGNLAGLLLLSPEGIELPLVFNRYLLLALPAVLLWVAAALRPAVAVVFLALFTLTGPFGDPGFRRSPFVHNDIYMEYCTPRGQLAAAEVPEIYRRLRGDGGADPLLEYPWIPLWRLNRALGAYQEVHGQDLVVASHRPAFWDERLAFRNMVPGDPESFLASRARHLVIHRDLAREEIRVPHTAHRPHDGLAERLEGELAGEAKAMARRLKRQWGPPNDADEWVQVWDLDAVRAQKGRTPGTP
jgi:hypothetical protein